MTKENNDAITAKSTYKKPKSEPQVVGPINDGMIGVATKQVASKNTSVKKTAAAARATSTLSKNKKDTVAIFSRSNISWAGVGKISKGYNIVTKEEAEQWLTRPQCREATPEEVAKVFGVK